MIETMNERLGRLLDDCPEVCAFNLSVKCKTQDGMICTLSEIRACGSDCPDGFRLNDMAASEAIKEVLRNMGLAESNNFLYSDVENIAIKANTITRIWAELDSSECCPVPVTK